MGRNRSRYIRKTATAVLSAALFLCFSIASAITVSAADTWETWPKKTVEPGVDKKTAAPAPLPSNSAPAAKAGEAAGARTAEGMSAGTIGWIAAGTAAVIGIGIAAGGGGGGSTTPAHH